MRIDQKYIEAHVPEGARVLDLGCGDGTLLEHLMENKHAAACGIDVDERAVRQCISRNVPVYHGDMLEGMAMMADGSYDCVILSQTLQQTLEPEKVVREMLRVGRKAIISFPNFGHWRVRLDLFLRGRMPVTHVLPYPWYDTPNVHLLTVRDFLNFCGERHLRTVDNAFFTASFRRLPGFAANVLAAVAVFVLEKE